MLEATLTDSRLQAVVAAAALRSAPALWAATEVALTAGASWADLEQAVEAAAQSAAEAVRLEALATLREVAARHGASERWGFPGRIES
ncbi:MAG: hypothetical protein EXR51_08010 [Dehalococcoidia bacterium]|nr:hypothetical protein [Dehalococcoidia bacterium]